MKFFTSNLKEALFLTAFCLTYSMVAQNLNVKGSDIRLGTSDGRFQGSKTGNRALVHNNDDILDINYAGDFEGGTRVTGNLDVRGVISNSGSDFRLGTSDGRFQGLNKSNRALVHNNGDILDINYAGDFEGGTRVTAFFDVNGRAVFDQKGVAYTSIRVGHNEHTRIFGDNSPNKFYGGGLFFRIHDESAPFKHRDVMFLAENGNVGIGARNPKNKLSVKGHIWAQEIKVMLTDGADWVFEEDYELKPLLEVEQYIKENKHLPEIPSADDFRKNDMKVSEMTNKLLQKIEELTLYTIEQEKKIEAQNSKNKVLKEQNTSLEKTVNSLENRLSRVEKILIK